MGNGHTSNNNNILCGCTTDNKCITPSNLGEVIVGSTDPSTNYITRCYQKFQNYNTPDNVNTLNLYTNSNNNDFQRFYSFSNAIQRKPTPKPSNLNINSDLKNKSINTQQEDKIICTEIDPKSFNDTKYKTDPKIIELKLLINNKKFRFSNKELYSLKTATNPMLNLSIKTLKYLDNTVYRGYCTPSYSRELYGKLYFPDGSLYQGFFSKNTMSGHGRLYKVDNYIYDGEFRNGMFEGYGKLKSLKGLSYEGLWKEDSQDGYGNETYEDGSSYSGNYSNGLKNGSGKYTWNNGNVYEGNFFNDEISGWGSCAWKDGKRYTGNWKKHLMDGKGIFIFADNKYYIGFYKEGKKNGYGIFSSGARNIEGFWKEGLQDGYSLYAQGSVKCYMKYEGGKKIVENITDKDEISKIDELFLNERLGMDYDAMKNVYKTMKKSIKNVKKRNDIESKSDNNNENISKISNTVNNKILSFFTNSDRKNSNKFSNLSKHIDLSCRKLSLMRNSVTPERLCHINTKTTSEISNYLKLNIIPLESEEKGSF